MSAGLFNNATVDAHDANLSVLAQLDETSGDRREISQSAPRTLSDNNTVGSAAGKLGPCALFTAANSEYLSSPFDVSRNKTKLSVSCWIYLNSIGAAQVIISENTDTVDASRLILCVDATNHLAMHMRDTSNGAAISCTSANTFSATTWYHILAVWDTVGDHVDAWVDGSPWISEAKTMGNFYDASASHKMKVGTYANVGLGWGGYFNGRIDQLAIWDDGLDVDDATALYNSGNGVPYILACAVRATLWSSHSSRARQRARAESRSDPFKRSLVSYNGHQAALGIPINILWWGSIVGTHSPARNRRKPKEPFKRSYVHGGEMSGAFPLGYDALRIYGSGAASDGAAQSNPNANLGGYRSSTELASLAIFGAISGFTIERAGEGHAAGLGVLESDGASKLRWTPAEATAPGPWTPAGSTVVNVADPSVPERGLRLRRNAGSFPAAGRQEIKLLEIFNGPFGFDNVSEAERSAGDVEYRAVFFRNEGLSSIGISLSTSSTGLKMAAETPGAGRDIQTIANEGTAPTGLSFETTATFTVAPGSSVGLWLERTIAGSASGSPLERHLITCEATINGVVYTLYLRGRYRIAETALERYELYAGVDVEPDLSGAPSETFTSLPYTTTATFTAGKDHHLVLRLRNRYNLISQNRVSTIIKLDGSGAEYGGVTAPSFAAAAGLAATIDIQAQYDYGLDASPADMWVVWWNVGSDPSPSGAPNYAETMVRSDGISKLSYNANGGFADAADVHVIVRARRLPGSTTDPDWAALTAKTAGEYVRTGNGFAYECTTGGTTDASKPSWPTTAGDTVVDGTVTWTCRAGVESTNTTALEVAADSTGPAQPDGGSFLGEAAEQQ